MTSISLIVYTLAVIAITITMVVLSRLLNPAQKNKRTNTLPFESGIVPTGSTDIRWNINYYLVAILFVLFDIEAVFLYIWTTVVVDAGWPAFFAVGFFIASLLLALAYQWRMGVLEWGKRQQDNTDRDAIVAARQQTYQLTDQTPSTQSATADDSIKGGL